MTFADENQHSGYERWVRNSNHGLSEFETGRSTTLRLLVRPVLQPFLPPYSELVALHGHFEFGDIKIRNTCIRIQTPASKFFAVPLTLLFPLFIVFLRFPFSCNGETYIHDGLQICF